MRALTRFLIRVCTYAQCMALQDRSVNTKHPDTCTTPAGGNAAEGNICIEAFSMSDIHVFIVNLDEDHNTCNACTVMRLCSV